MSGAAELFVSFVGTNPVVQGLVGGLIIAFLNLLGALAVLVWRNPSHDALNGALGFAGGVMLAASFTSLILPGIERGGMLPVFAGIALGALVLSRAESWVPQVHQVVTGRVLGNGSSRRAPGRAPRASAVGAVPAPAETATTAAGLSHRGVAGTVFFIVAITLHNMPEGLAVGVGFGSGNIGNALALTIAIGLQNIPEGLAVAVSARQAGIGSLTYAAVTGVRAGLVEIPLAVFGAAVIVVAAPLLPYAMGFAAGGMLYVIAHEIIPATHARGRQRTATLALIAGAVLMLFLDVALA